MFKMYGNIIHYIFITKGSDKGKSILYEKLNIF